jgi:hypothetical protein
MGCPVELFAALAFCGIKKDLVNIAESVIQQPTIAWPYETIGDEQLQYFV